MFDGISLDELLAFNTYMKHGGVESTFECQNIMFKCLAEVGPLWRASSYGIDLEGRTWTHAIWADNIQPFSNAVDHLNIMVRSLTEMLLECQLEWNMDSL